MPCFVRDMLYSSYSLFGISLHSPDFLTINVDKSGLTLFACLRPLEERWCDMALVKVKSRISNL